MNQRLPQLKARDIIRVLKRLGFYETHQKGSHLFFKHNDRRFTSVPIHGREDIGRGLLRQIVREIKISPQEFIELL